MIKDLLLDDWTMDTSGEYFSSKTYWNELLLDPDTMDSIYSSEEAKLRIPETFYFSDAQRKLVEDASKTFTIHQKRVYDLHIKQGLSQTETAKILDTAQCNINFAINGVKVYKGKYKGNRYGGIKQKIRVYIEELEISKRICGLRESGYDILQIIKITGYGENRIYKILGEADETNREIKVAGRTDRKS